MNVIGVLVQSIVNNKLVFRADLYIITGLELPVLHMVLLHSHKSCIGIGLAIAASVAKKFLLLLVLLQVWNKIFINVAGFGFCLGTGLVISPEDLINLTGGLFHLFLFYFFKIRRCRILVL